MFASCISIPTQKSCLRSAGRPGCSSPRGRSCWRGSNRPATTLQRDSLPPVDQWMPPGSLYKLARTPGAASGVRAFGRLALFDNYRLIAQRVRQEIETFLNDESLAKADKVRPVWGCAPTARERMSSPGSRAEPAAACSWTSPTSSATSCARLVISSRRSLGCSSSLPQTKRRRGTPPWGMHSPRWPSCITSRRRRSRYQTCVRQIGSSGR